MPIEQEKVRDLLRYQNIFRKKIIDEVDTYHRHQTNTQFENGLLTYVTEASWGDLKELLKDVGITRQNIPFFNVSDMIKIKDNNVMESDKNFPSLTNSRFAFTDMTDYEYDFPSFNEV